MTDAFAHETVMPDEVLELLAPRPGGFYADCTLGGGGHAEAILEAGAPDARVLGVDRDESALSAARQRLARFGERVIFEHGDFGDLPMVLQRHGRARVDGLVADLGVSSPQLDRAERGFAFGQEGPLDMRMDPSQGETAQELLQRVDESELADILYKYGEERRSRAVARSICRARERQELSTTAQLRSAVVRVLGPRRGRIDPATRTFQALRIMVNGELEQLEQLIEALPVLLEDEAVAAIISFHSLEDRMVKHRVRNHALLTPVTKRPLTACAEESAYNPRSRSAKLRGARRLPRVEGEQAA